MTILRLVLGDHNSAFDVALLKRLGVKRVVNCSPQTVKTTGCIAEHGSILGKNDRKS